MSRKRKAPQTEDGDEQPELSTKRTLKDSALPAKERKNKDTPYPPPPAPSQTLTHPVLSFYFSRLLTLRDYLAILLTTTHPSPRSLKKLAAVTKQTDSALCHLLDTTLVGLTEEPPAATAQEIHDLTQSGNSEHSTQNETVDLILQLLFHRAQTAPSRSKHALYPGKPNNVLTYGYHHNTSNRRSIGGRAGMFGLEIVNKWPNSQVNTVKGPAWERLLGVVGQEVMMAVLLEVGVFMAVGERGNYYQLVGPPISDPVNIEQAATRVETETKHIRPRNPSVPTSCAAGTGDATKIPPPISKPKNTASKPETRSPTDIHFVKWRMFYAKPSHSRTGAIIFGLHHVHVLNRIDPSPSGARIVLKYIFPRQFSFHNVFTSDLDRSRTTTSFRDYTVRTDDIAAWTRRYGAPDKGPIPKRLRGRVLQLVERMVKLNKRCAYDVMVKYYCPAALCDPGVMSRRPTLRQVAGEEREGLVTQTGILSSVGQLSAESLNGEREGLEKASYLDYASTMGEVSAFVRAALNRVVPHEFFGGARNRKMIAWAIDRFIRLRRYERFSLHDVIQGIKITECTWLCPSNVSPEDRMSATDESKRRELLAEFLYWLFDSFLIPLIRAHFYVTETSAAKNRLFYFRHDVWKKLSEPALNQLKLNMFEPLPRTTEKEVLKYECLGIAGVRLLPKERGVRPIMNLRRKMTGVFGRFPGSVNQKLAPVRQVLNYQMKNGHHRITPSAIFSVSQIHPLLTAFKSQISPNPQTKLYFVKLDVQACFDTIPPKSMYRLASRILEHDEYRLDKYTDVQPPDDSRIPAKPFPKWNYKAKPFDDPDLFSDYVHDLAPDLKRGSVLVDEVRFQDWKRDKLLELIRKHLTYNVVKIGKKLYRQKRGIPQGSTLSTLLCAYFYGDLEQRQLPFAADQDSLLLRMVDDFLFITLDRSKAVRFLRTMHAGLPDYGVTISHSKTLVNFETSVDNQKIPRLVNTVEFPYCGNLINTKTLTVKKDRESAMRGTTIADALTVDYSQRPGLSLLRKTVKAWKLNCAALWMDTNLNSVNTVHRNIFCAFVEVAMKFHASVRSLARGKRDISGRQMKRVVEELFDTAYTMVKTRKKSVKGKRFECRVGRGTFTWLGVQAFKKVLGRKQSSYRELLGWLEEVEEKQRIERKRVKGLKRTVEGCGVGEVKY